MQSLPMLDTGRLRQGIPLETLEKIDAIISIYEYNNALCIRLLFANPDAKFSSSSIRSHKIYVHILYNYCKNFTVYPNMHTIKFKFVCFIYIE